MAPRRLPPAAPTQGGRPLAFRWGGRTLQGVEGDTVASALVGAGEDVLSRSIKYHRPRGYLCGVGACANCLCTIDGRPSQRACMVPLREGLVAQPQNCWPSARHDLLGLTDKLFPKGFDPQRSFTRPAALLPLYYRFVRRMAGLGKVPRGEPPARPAPVARERVPLAVVGAGPAGLAAAWEAARCGVGVRLLDEQAWPGGRLAREGARLAGPGTFHGMPPQEALRVLVARTAQAGVDRWERANVAGVYPERVLAVATPRRLVEVEAVALVLATGAPESLPAFGDNDRPGVMSAGAAGTLVRRHRVLPGERVVMLGADARALDAAEGLAQAGAIIEALVAHDAPEELGHRVVRGEPVRVLGSRRVEGLEVRVGAESLRLACDLVVYAEPRRPLVELAQQAGCALRDEGIPAVRADDGATSAARVFACGDVVQPGSLERALASGRVAGLRAAQALGAKVDEARLQEARDELEAAR